VPTCSTALQEVDKLRRQVEELKDHTQVGEKDREIETLKSVLAKVRLSTVHQAYVVEICGEEVVIAINRGRSSVQSSAGLR
jgi:plasmid stabilization system protein ParE